MILGRLVRSRQPMKTTRMSGTKAAIKASRISGKSSVVARERMKGEDMIVGWFRGWEIWCGCELDLETFVVLVVDV